MPSALHPLAPNPSQPLLWSWFEGRGQGEHSSSLCSHPGPLRPCSSSDPSLTAAGGDQAALHGETLSCANTNPRSTSVPGLQHHLTPGRIQTQLCHQGLLIQGEEQGQLHLSLGSRSDLVRRGVWQGFLSRKSVWASLGDKSTVLAIPMPVM